ncbi:7-cyano-7-deazaguanine synthase QueC [bacterium]|nr:7-cyano-7-deazaguanine synthase QueC [bacterium]
MSEKKAIVLLSGGLDSAVTLAYAIKQGFCCYALSFDYGQRHKIELKRAKKIATTLGAQVHKVVAVDLRSFGGSALTADIPVPAAREQIGEQEQIPATYVPARNTVFLSLALAWAEVVHAEAIFIGANSVDYSGYPDCRPEYLEAYEKLAGLATKAGTSEQWQLKIAAPLLRMTKADIVKLGKELELDFSLTSSCYNPQQDGTPCRNCEACLLRAKGFAEANEIDTTIP